jgi:hypothetical protein
MSDISQVFGVEYIFSFWMDILDLNGWNLEKKLVSFPRLRAQLTYRMVKF